MVYCSWSLLWSVIRNEYNKELSHQHFGPRSSLSCLVFWSPQNVFGSPTMVAAVFDFKNRVGKVSWNSRYRVKIWCRERSQSRGDSWDDLSSGGISSWIWGAVGILTWPIGRRIKGACHPQRTLVGRRSPPTSPGSSQKQSSITKTR